MSVIQWGESVTWFNIGVVYVGLGDQAQVERLLARMVALDEATGHPGFGRLRGQEGSGSNLAPFDLPEG